MEELHSDSIDGGHEASYGLGHVPGRGRTPTTVIVRRLSSIPSDESRLFSLITRRPPYIDVRPRRPTKLTCKNDEIVHTTHTIRTRKKLYKKYRREYKRSRDV
jgi:hypothetical protein